MPNKNRIVEVKITLVDDNQWEIAVTKEFEEKNGGGTATFREFSSHIHGALDVARGMVTVSAGQNPNVVVKE
jgi:hypothetical protein